MRMVTFKCNEKRKSMPVVCSSLIHHHGVITSFFNCRSSIRQGTPGKLQVSLAFRNLSKRSTLAVILSCWTLLGTAHTLGIIGEALKQSLMDCQTYCASSLPQIWIVESLACSNQIDVSLLLGCEGALPKLTNKKTCVRS
ncbi:hypothetical protein ACS0TY_034906 [Phlomoides rotata]